jgi:hypothetical protein
MINQEISIPERDVGIHGNVLKVAGEVLRALTLQRLSLIVKD